MVNFNNQTTNGLKLSQEETDVLLAAVRAEVAEQIFDSSDTHRLQQMVECLGDSRGMVRLGFADTLGKIGTPATPFLVEALAHHSDPVVRRAAAKTLTLIADPATISPLVNALLHDEDTVVHGSAVGALARIGAAAVPVLLEIIAAPELRETTKGHAAWALAFIGPEAKEYLYQEITSETAAVRAAVVGAIAKIAQDEKEEQAFNVLINALTDDEAMVRIEAAAVLGNLAYASTTSHLLKLLAYSDGESRKAGALALMKIGDRSALPALQAILPQESDPAIQQVIKLAISQIERKLDQDEDDWE
ncbi:MAG: HEAT repeat domain-containing protein [Gomphosphaeria aponina SAG 52.96 = DSM 107014]|uniref:HEAT repeat domain-containing protein n=1 Tax=Gomphosphaeria aponina SAG 52.96 = DSM 107014 TaxID=1521640 RepID=A0A941GPW6_9CHRO|nr:HEAT repeat domain-containing protein [Gomphosphaeria aponina SAG 52.96 = DSM 107014]